MSIASAGHCAAQEPQDRHSSVMKKAMVLPPYVFLSRIPRFRKYCNTSQTKINYKNENSPIISAQGGDTLSGDAPGDPLADAFPVSRARVRPFRRGARGIIEGPEGGLPHQKQREIYSARGAGHRICPRRGGRTGPRVHWDGASAARRRGGGAGSRRADPAAARTGGGDAAPRDPALSRGRAAAPAAAGDERSRPKGQLSAAAAPAGDEPSRPAGGGALHRGGQ